MKLVSDTQALREEVDKRLLRMLPYQGITEATLDVVRRLGPHEAISAWAVLVLGAQGDLRMRDARLLLLGDAEVWQKLLGIPISPEKGRQVLEGFTSELRFQATEGADQDIVFLADLTARIARDKLIADPPEWMIPHAEQLLEVGASLYPTMTSLAAKPGEPEQIKALMTEVETRAAAFNPIEIKLPELPPTRPRRRAIEPATVKKRTARK